MPKLPRAKKLTPRAWNGTFSLEPEQWEAIQDFRISNGFTTKAAALRAMIEMVGAEMRSAKK